MKEKEIRSLLFNAEKAVRNGGSLTAVFGKTAKTCGMSLGSVRNYYYALIKRAETDARLAEKFPTLKTVAVRKKIVFSKDEEEKLVKAVDEKIKNGKSVRRAIRELSCGDEKLALRLQNKYRNATASRRKSKTSPYRKICAAIDALIEKLLAVRSENGEAEKENGFFKSGLAADQDAPASSIATEYFSRRDKNTGTDKK